VNCLTNNESEAILEGAAASPDHENVDVMYPGLNGRRIAMVTFSCYPGDARPRRSIKALLSQGACIDLICLMDGSNPSRENVGALHITRLAIKQRRTGTLAYVWQYFTFIVQSSLILAVRASLQRYDLVYVNNMPDILIISAMVPKALGAKVILDMHDPMPELMSTIYSLTAKSTAVRLIAALEKWSLARAHRVLTVNLACKRLFSSRSCSADKVGVIMNTPDESIFKLNYPARMHASPTPTRRPYVIMYHGSLVERNGLALAVEAFAHLRKRVPNTELRIYGRHGLYLDKVLEKARTLDVDDAVHYLGPKSLDELVTEIRNCDVGVIPNHLNPFTEINTPVRIFEYLSQGKPVIAPRTHGILEYFNDDSLILFEAGSLADLTSQLYYAYEHPDAVRETIIRGQKVLMAHTWAKERERLLDQVNELVSVRLVGKSLVAL
jgi:glycosyltransferase involved in cell wall biosynthesis